jgi:hypothetical protein
MELPLSEQSTRSGQMGIRKAADGFWVRPAKRGLASGWTAIKQAEREAKSRERQITATRSAPLLHSG